MHINDHLTRRGLAVHLIHWLYFVSTVLIILSHVALFLNKRRSTRVVEATSASPDYQSNAGGSTSQNGYKRYKVRTADSEAGKKTGIPIHVSVIIPRLYIYCNKSRANSSSRQSPIPDLMNTSIVTRRTRSHQSVSQKQLGRRLLMC